MGERLYMAVDLGTSFIKTGVYDLSGNYRAGASVPVQDERPEAGIFIQRGEMLWQSVCDCLKKTAKALGDEAMARRREKLTGNWRNAFDDTTGLMVENTAQFSGGGLYEGVVEEEKVRPLQA